MKRIISKNPLFFAFFFPAVTDGVITLLGQDPSYWTNRVVNEASPAYYLLLISPWLFGVSFVFWLVFWYWIFKKLKEPFNLFLMFLFVAGHSWGSSSWIWKIMRANDIYTSNNRLSIIFAWSTTIIYLALISLFAAYCLRIYMRRK